VAFTYQFGANPTIDAPRLLIADTDATHPIFDDREIQLMYTIDPPVVFTAGQSQDGTIPLTYGTASYRRVAAGLLDALASNKARLSAALEVLDIKLDPSKAAKALMDQANNLRTIDDNSATFALVELVHDQFTWRERVWKQWLRKWGG
jgi:hypothetical protein